jgi:hypothetical protein
MNQNNFIKKKKKKINNIKHKIRLDLRTFLFLFLKVELKI